MPNSREKFPMIVVRLRSDGEVNEMTIVTNHEYYINALEPAGWKIATRKQISAFYIAPDQEENTDEVHVTVTLNKRKLLDRAVHLAIIGRNNIKEGSRITGAARLLYAVTAMQRVLNKLKGS